MQCHTWYAGLMIRLCAVLVPGCGVISTTDQLSAGYSGVPISTLEQATFDSPLAAVMAAANKYNPVSIAQDREFIGVIVHHDGTYAYTVGRGQSGADTVTVRVAIPRNAEIVAFWHTHGADGHGRRYFSGVDTALANSWNKPLYLADFSGALRVFHPGDSTMTAMQARRMGLGDLSGYAKGDNVQVADGRRARIATHVLARQ